MDALFAPRHGKTERLITDLSAQLVALHSCLCDSAPSWRARIRAAMAGDPGARLILRGLGVEIAFQSSLRIVSAEPVVSFDSAGEHEANVATQRWERQPAAHAGICWDGEDGTDPVDIAHAPTMPAPARVGEFES